MHSISVNYFSSMLVIDACHLVLTVLGYLRLTGNCLRFLCKEREREKEKEKERERERERERRRFYNTKYTYRPELKRLK